MEHPTFIDEFPIECPSNRQRDFPLPFSIPKTN